MSHLLNMPSLSHHHHHLLIYISAFMYSRHFYGHREMMFLHSFVRALMTYASRQPSYSSKRGQLTYVWKTTSVVFQEACLWWRTEQQGRHMAWRAWLVTCPIRVGVFCGEHPISQPSVLVLMCGCCSSLPSSKCAWRSFKPCFMLCHLHMFWSLEAETILLSVLSYVSLNVTIYKLCSHFSMFYLLLHFSSSICVCLNDGMAGRNNPDINVYKRWTYVPCLVAVSII